MGSPVRQPSVFRFLSDALVVELSKKAASEIRAQCQLGRGAA